MGLRTHQAIARGIAAGIATGIATTSLAVAMAATLGTAARAKELKFPDDRPEVVMDVPDDWSMEKTPAGLQLRSPEKNSIVVMKVIAKDKRAAESYAKTTIAALEAFGVTFSATAKKPEKPAAPPAPKAAPPAALPTLESDGKPGGLTFSGAPSLAVPGTQNSNNQQAPSPASLEAITGLGAPPPAPTAGAHLPLRAAQYFGTSLGGKPVDVQFVLFNLPDNRFLAMMQESGSDDGRAVAMAQSVKSLK